MIDPRSLHEHLTVEKTEKTCDVSGLVIKSKCALIKGMYISQVVIRTDREDVTCLWRGDKAIALKDNTRYHLVGRSHYVKGRRVIFDPTYTLMTARGSKGVAALPAAKSSPAGSRLSSVKRRVIGVGAGFAALVVLIGIVNAPTDSKTLPHKDASTTNSSNLNIDAVAAGASISNSITPKPVYTPDDCDLVAVPFTATTKNDPNLPIGQTKLSPAGSDGQDKTCYVTGRDQPPVTTRVTQPVDQVKLMGTYVAPAPPPVTRSCDGYIDVDGNCIPSPSTTGGTAGGYTPTFTCKDGTYSYAQHSQGACSHHGGILH